MREAPSVVLIETLTAAGARVVAYDPGAMDEARRLLPGHPAFDYMTSVADDNYLVREAH